jgi:hypothetical protein
MVKFKWFFDRWKIFQHPREEIYRIQQQIQYRLVDKHWARCPSLKRNFNFSNLFENKYSLEGMRKVISELPDDYYRLKILNTVIPDIFAYNEWNYDIKNKIACKEEFVHHISDFDYSKGEVKYVFELSRLYHFPQAMAYAIVVNQESLLFMLLEQIQSWYKANPFLKTLAWKSGNEVGIRSINLIIFRIITNIENSDSKYKELVKFNSFFDDLLELHFKFLITHLSLYSSKGNHFLGELAGIIAICSVYKFNNSDKYLSKYFDELCSELLRLIHKDGFNKEQATRYQATYINLFITSFQFAKERGYVLPQEVEQRLKAMYLFLKELKISSKQYFILGDDDDAQLIYPYADGDYNIYESMLNDLTILFDSETTDDYHFDLRNYLLFGDDGYRKYLETKKQVKEKDRNDIRVRIFERSGYFLISDKNISLLFDIGPIGLQPTMSHGHSDILSISLFYRNMPVIVDTGTYQYNVHYKKYRDYFHGVYSHNTIAVNNDDQAVMSEGMFWLSNPKVQVEDYSLNLDNPYCIACHDGYVRKKYQVIHKRKVEYNVEKKKIIITDILSGKGKNKIDFSLHFHPSINLDLKGNTLAIFNKNIPLSIYNRCFHSGVLYKGDDMLPKGWYSSSYDSLEPSYTFVMSQVIDGDCELITEILF